MIFLFTYLKRLTLLLLIYSASRIYFFINNINNLNNTTIIDFIEGLRFDLSALVYINIPLFILLLLPNNLRTKDSFLKFTNLIFYVINIPFIIMNNIDIEYFRFTQKRSGIDFLQLLTLAKDTRYIIPQYIKEYWEITLFTIIQIWLLLKIKYIPKQNILFNTKSILSNILFFLVGTCIVTLLARGGFQLKPIKPINAGEISNSQNPSLILNTPFCILHSIDEKQLTEYDYFTKEELDSIFFPIHPKKNINKSKKNIIIFIMESYSKEFVGFYNNGDGYTPFLDELMQNSLVFTNAYANGLKSIEALPAITASIPALMDNPFITSNYAQNNFNSIASILNEYGYNTSFYHGGIRGTMGFHSFSKKARFNNYFGMEEYNNVDDFDKSWGIYDGPFMQFFLNGINQEKEPFLSTFFSLSSHPPYTLPDNYLKDNKEYSKLKKISILETIGYTDDCLKEFFNKCKNEEWFRNTIFIITADHTSPENYNKKYKTKIGRYTIPLIIFSGDSSLQGLNTNIVQHIDIMPTILDLIGNEKPFFAFGKSMFSKESWAINFLEGRYNLITDSSIIMNKEEVYQSFSYQNIFEENNLDTNKLKLLKAIKQDYNNRMINNKLSNEN